MSSRQLRKQARRNGALAAGTKSPAGIETSSKNAIKHGLTSKMIVLTNESQARFDELHETYIETFRPTNGVEMDLVDQMVASQWRLRRIWIMQTAALDLKMDQQEPKSQKTSTRSTRQRASPSPSPPWRTTKNPSASCCATKPPTPPEAEPEPGPKIILGSPEFVEMIAKLKSHRDEFEPRPEKVE